MKLNIIALVFTLSCFYSCSERVESPKFYDPSQLQDGQTGIIENVDLSGKGQILNKANTTVVFIGNVIVDDLTVIGKVILAENSTLTIKGLLTVAGGAKLQLNGNVAVQNLTLVGDLFINSSILTVSGQFTAAGGTNTFFQNGLLRVNDCRILGNLYALQNDFTEKTNGYSMVELIGIKYLNRAGGSVVCGPLLWNSNADQGTSGVEFNEVKPKDEFKNAVVVNPYGFNNDTKFYKYSDICNAISIALPFN